MPGPPSRPPILHTGILKHDSSAAGGHTGAYGHPQRGLKPLPARGLHPSFLVLLVVLICTSLIISLSNASCKASLLYIICLGH